MNIKLKRNKQIPGQITIFEVMNYMCEPAFFCRACICSSCLLYKSGRCPYGGCYDEKRAVDKPFDTAHPERPPRTFWSNWKTEQMYWCRGGVFYPAGYCKHYIKYTGSNVRECLRALITIYQDGYISCSLVETFGCENCYKEYCERKDKE